MARAAPQQEQSREDDEDEALLLHDECETSQGTAREVAPCLAAFDADQQHEQTAERWQEHEMRRVSCQSLDGRANGKQTIACRSDDPRESAEEMIAQEIDQDNCQYIDEQESPMQAAGVWPKSGRTTA